VPWYCRKGLIAVREPFGVFLGLSLGRDRRPSAAARTNGRPQVCVTTALGERRGDRAVELGLRYLVGCRQLDREVTTLTVADPCIWHDSGTGLSRRQLATMAGSTTWQARVCLLHPHGPRPRYRLLSSTRAARTAGCDDGTRALSLGSCDHLQPVRALSWANARFTLLPGSAAFTLVPRCSPLVLVR